MTEIKCKNEAEAREKWHEAIHNMPKDGNIFARALPKYLQLTLSKSSYIDAFFNERTIFTWEEDDEK